MDALPLLEAEAKERQRVHGRTAPGKTLEAKMPQVNRAPQARDHAAKLMGTSPRYVSDADGSMPRAVSSAWAGGSVRLSLLVDRLELVEDQGRSADK